VGGGSVAKISQMRALVADFFLFNFSDFADLLLLRLC
jgi:hypothetical protein